MKDIYEPSVSCEDGFTIMEMHPEKYALNDEGACWYDKDTKEIIETARVLHDDPGDKELFDKWLQFVREWDHDT